MSDVHKTRQVRLARRSPGYWRITFDIPPLNIFGPETIQQLNEIVTALETDEQVKVVVFDSAVEGFCPRHREKHMAQTSTLQSSRDPTSRASMRSAN